MKDKMDALRKPFNPDEIEWMITATSKDKAQGLIVPFVSNRAVQHRLDEVFGVTGWKNEYKPWKEESANVSAQLCGISIWDAEKKEWITKWDGAADTDIEPVKGGLSASMKRAACMFGIGRYLYDIEPLWVPIEPSGKSYRIHKGYIPALPAWALPEGVKNKSGSASPKPQQTQAPQNTTQTPQGNAPQPPSPQTPTLTERQVNRAYVKGRNANMQPHIVEEVSVGTYKKNVRHLTKDEYEAFCRWLDNKAAEV